MRNKNKLGCYVILTLGATMLLASCTTQRHAVYQKKSNGEVGKLHRSTPPQCVQNW